MSAVRLPVCGREVTLALPTGCEDLLLLEAPVLDTSLALALLGRLAGPAGDWGALCVPDLDALVLRLRQLVFGDLLRAEAVCPAAGCGRRFDVSFAVEDYLASQEPAAPEDVEPDPESSWYRLRESGVRFRLPTGADQAAVAREADPEGELARRCIQPADA